MENKKFSVTVRYRQCHKKSRTRSRILKVASSLSGARLIRGNQAISIVSADAPNKGTALRAEADRLGCDRALYIGDDETDEDVFTTDGGAAPHRDSCGKKPRVPRCLFHPQSR